MKLSAVIITRNEAKRIGDCLKSLRFCDEIVVVDSGSSDDTAALASGSGARVLTRPFDDFASQKNFAVSNARGPWVLSVDADEVVTPELEAAIVRAVDSPGDFSAFSFERRNFIFGRRLRHGGVGADRPVRLFQKDRARFESPVHETLRADGSVGVLKGALLHYSTPDLRSYFQKLTLYSTLEARTLVSRQTSFGPESMLWRPLGKFLQRYIFQSGFLDGPPGFIFAVLSGYYEWVRLAIFWEMGGGFFGKLSGPFHERGTR